MLTFGTNDATFGRPSAKRGYMLWALVAGLLGFQGCSFPQGIPTERYEQAEELVDQGTRAMREGRLDDAQAAFSLSWELAQLAAALDGEGCVAFLRGDLVRAELLFRRAYESDATYDEALGNLALVLDAAGRREEALQAYDALLESHPEAAESRSNRAALMFDLGDGLAKVRDELAKAALVLGPGIASENLEVAQKIERKMHGKEGN